MSTSPATYVLTLRPERSDVPEEIRVRRALKVMLRTFGLRCTSIVEADANAVGAIENAEKLRIRTTPPVATAPGETLTPIDISPCAGARLSPDNPRPTRGRAREPADSNSHLLPLTFRPHNPRPTRAREGRRKSLPSKHESARRSADAAPTPPTQGGSP